jgi:hypothetical protein
LHWVNEKRGLKNKGNKVNKVKSDLEDRERMTQLALSAIEENGLPAKAMAVGNLRLRARRDP